MLKLLYVNQTDGTNDWEEGYTEDKVLIHYNFVAEMGYDNAVKEMSSIMEDPAPSSTMLKCVDCLCVTSFELPDKWYQTLLKFKSMNALHRNGHSIFKGVSDKQWDEIVSIIQDCLRESDSSDFVIK